MEQTPISAAEIDAARSAKGGFKARTLAQWGVPYPPPKGWRKSLIKNGVPYRHEHDGETELERAQRVLRRAVLAVIETGNGHLFHDEPEVLEYFGSVNPNAPTPQPSETAA